MEYFRYADSLDSAMLMNIYTTVRGLENYAKSIYKGLWEDALDEAFFHIIRHYNSDFGADLEHYATKVIRTIKLNKYSKEIEHDTALTTALDKKSIEDSNGSPLEILLEKEEEILKSEKDCREYLTPYFIHDYKFFKSRKSEDRKLSYKDLFKKFTAETISNTMFYLVNTYQEGMERMLQLCRSCHFRKFPADRYLKSMDTVVEYLGELNGIVMYHQMATKQFKYFYYLNIEELINNLVDVFYCDSSHSLVVEGLEVYCDLSGTLVIGIEELKDCLESELVGAILARVSRLKVVKYEKGKSILLTSPKKDDRDIIFEIFQRNVTIHLRRVVAKKF